MYTVAFTTSSREEPACESSSTQTLERLHGLCPDATIYNFAGLWILAKHRNAVQYVVSVHHVGIKAYARHCTLNLYLFATRLLRGCGGVRS